MSKEISLPQALSKALLSDLFQDLDIARRRWLKLILQPLVVPSIKRFANIAAVFDQHVEKSNLVNGMRQILPNFVSSIRVWGEESVPRQGPLLVISNHPGTYDSIAIAAAIPRQDLKIVAFGFPFLQQLPSASQYLIFVSHDMRQRIQAVRQGIRHLEKGGALLIFPAGRVEPDPAVLPGALAALKNWSPSVEVFLRKVPAARLQPVAVSGVLSPVFLRNPLIRFWRGTRDPQAVAEVIQVAVQMLFPGQLHLEPQISFGVSTTTGELLAQVGESTLIEVIVQRSKQLLAEHCASASVLLKSSRNDAR